MSHVIDATRNGVDSRTLYGTLDAIKADPSLGVFQFRVSNEWIGGAHNRSAIQVFYGAGQEDQSRDEAFHVDAGERCQLREQLAIPAGHGIELEPQRRIHPAQRPERGEAGRVGDPRRHDEGHGLGFSTDGVLE